MTVPLVLVPGHMCDAAMWAHQAATLGDIAEVTIADVTNGASVGELATHIIDKAPASFALAGLSLGGYVCFEVMRQASDRVTHLALLDTTARADPPEIIARRHRFIGMAREGRLDEVMASYLPLFVHPRRLEDEPFKARLAEMSARVGEATFYKQQDAMLSRPDSRPGLGDICCPTLVLCGRQDALTPLEVHREMASLIPGSRLVIIEDSGHLTTMEQPEATTAVLRYWLQEPRRR
jgi:pimeloyl-ACP methyl ester carboxylesterase